MPQKNAIVHGKNQEIKQKNKTNLSQKYDVKPFILTGLELRVG